MSRVFRPQFIVVVLWSILLLQVFCEASEERSFSGKIVGVSDGDTLKVMNEGRAEKVRLLGIDCPEKAQAYGKKAKQFASDLAFGKVVTVKFSNRDLYGRILGEVWLENGRSLNQELLKAGLAWWYRRYSKDKALEKMETEARKAKKGLWADPNPIPPWEWRKSKKN